MIKADWYYIQNLRKILKEGSWDENPRPKWADGTPANSKFITGVFEEYDISKGEFPITTLRNTAIKTGIREILWIYQKQSNSLVEAREMGINWWDEWNVGNDTIGQRYGATVKRYKLMDNLLDGLKNSGIVQFLVSIILSIIVIFAIKKAFFTKKGESNDITQILPKP